MNRQLIVTILVVLFFNSSLSRADSKQDDDFEDLLFDLCVIPGPTLFAQGWDGPSLIQLNNLCLNVLEGGASASSDTSTAVCM